MNRERRSLRQRLLPHPWLALWLWVGWLLLNETLAPGHLLLGLLLAVVISGIQSRRDASLVASPPPDGAEDPARRPHRGGLRRTVVALRLLVVVLWDIVVANTQVAILILGPQSRLRPRFFSLPLAVTHPRSITLLACIITMTPGTLSSEVSNDHRHLLVHGLDVDDEAALIAQIKSRYEAPIKEIFE